MVQVKCGFDNSPSTSGSELLAMFGPTLLVDIGFDPSWTGTAVPIAGMSGVHALVDSGAGESCIDSLLAAKLNLPIVDRRQVSGISGAHSVNMYLAQVHVPSLAFTIHGAFAGVDLKAGGQVHEALIGRTFLRHFTMIYEGRTGTVIISSE